MTHTNAGYQGQRSVGLKARVERNRLTDGHARSHYLLCYAVGSYHKVGGVAQW